jgi:phosphatidylglycerophosphate synthase
VSRKLQRLWATKNKDDEWWSSFVTAPLAVLVNFVVVDFKCLSPNRVTLLSLIVALVSSYLIIIGGQFYFLIAAALINVSHVLDCMDGQMARYRESSTRYGSFFDKVTDLVQVYFWFAALGYAAYLQTGDVLPIFLAFTGVSFYSLRGYIKYVIIYTLASDDTDDLDNSIRAAPKFAMKEEDSAGLGHGFVANVKWFMSQQRKFLSFDEGVFVFMLSIALTFNILNPILWIFAGSQIFYGIVRTYQGGLQLQRVHSPQIVTTTEK